MATTIPENIYNINEKGFLVGLWAWSKVICSYRDFDETCADNNMKFITFQRTPHTCYNLWMFASLVLVNVPIELQSILNNATRFGNFSIDKAAIYGSNASCLYNSQYNISAAFRACRTAPFNSRVVLSKLLYAVSNITPSGSSPTRYPKYTSCYS